MTIRLPESGWRRSLLTRAFILGLAALGVAISYFVILQIGPEARARAEDAAPIAFVIGVLLGLAMWTVDRIWPRAFSRLGSLAIGPGVLGVLGVLMLLGESAILVVAAGFAGFVVPIATPLARFPSDKAGG